MSGSTQAYLSALLKDFNVASVTPTSPTGVRRLLDGIAFERARVVVEYGPGTGVISKPLLERMPAESRLFLIERNPDFARTLRDALTDPRVTICQGDAADAARFLADHGHDAADYVISGIPFSLMNQPTRERIVRRTHALLNADGAFLAYQFIWQPDRYLHDPLAETFAHLSTDVVFRNIPPLRLFDARKNGAQ